MTVCQARHPEEAAPVYSLLGLRAGEGASAADRGNHTVFYGDIHTGANGHIRRQDVYKRQVMESAAEEQEAKHQAKSKKAQEPEKKEEDSDIGKELMVKVTSIEPNREQPRKDFNEEAMGELAESMKVYGVLQPLLEMCIRDRER